MGCYIQFRQELLNHPKFLRFRRILKLSKSQAAGHLACLWAWVPDYAPNGVLTGLDNTVIAEAADWQGDPDEFVNALINCRVKDGGSGFIDVEPLRIHNWLQYIGDTMRKRIQRARKPHNSSPIPDNVQTTSGQRRDKHAKVQPSTEQYSTEQSSTGQDSTEQKNGTTSPPVPPDDFAPQVQNPPDSLQQLWKHWRQRFGECWPPMDLEHPLASRTPLRYQPEPGDGDRFQDLLKEHPVDRLLANMDNYFDAVLHDQEKRPELRDKFLSRPASVKAVFSSYGLNRWSVPQSEAENRGTRDNPEDYGQAPPPMGCDDPQGRMLLAQAAEIRKRKAREAKGATK